MKFFMHVSRAGKSPFLTQLNIMLVTGNIKLFTSYGKPKVTDFSSYRIIFKNFFILIRIKAKTFDYSHFGSVFHAQKKDFFMHL